MSMLFDRSSPLIDASDKAENQILQCYNVISHQSLRFSFLFRWTPSYVIRKVTLVSFDRLKNDLFFIRIKYKALSTAL